MDAVMRQKLEAFFSTGDGADEVQRVLEPILDAVMAARFAVESGRTGVAIDSLMRAELKLRDLGCRHPGNRPI